MKKKYYRKNEYKKNVTGLPNHVFFLFFKYICIVVKSVNIFIYYPSYGKVLLEEIIIYIYNKNRKMKNYYKK